MNPYNAKARLTSQLRNLRKLLAGKGVSIQLAPPRKEIELSENVGSVCYSFNIVATSTTGIVVPANTSRSSLALANKGTVPIYLTLGSTAIVGQGIIIEPNFTYRINSTNSYNGALSAITAVGNANLSIEECITAGGTPSITIPVPTTTTTSTTTGA